MKTKTILVVEDDEKTASLVSVYLEREGFRALIAGDGQQALDLASTRHPDLMILDLMLPVMGGWEIFSRLRSFSQIPVIMLTARGEEVDRVAGLTLGADDYVVKPFSPRELVARVQAVLRRSSVKEKQPERIYRHDRLSLNTNKRRLKVDDTYISLTPREYALVEALMAHPGRVFTRDELIGRLYPARDAVVIDRVVDVHIGKLRQKIEPVPARPRYIITERGVGYRFADPVED